MQYICHVYLKNNLKDAVLQAIIEFQKELKRCKEFNDDIDDDYN